MPARDEVTGSARPPGTFTKRQWVDDVSKGCTLVSSSPKCSCLRLRDRRADSRLESILRAAAAAAGSAASYHQNFTESPQIALRDH